VITARHSVHPTALGSMSSADAENLRQLKIKTGSVKRLFKEERSYRIEARDATAVLQRLKAEGADDAVIRNAERVVKDSEQMIPHTQTSLDKAVEGLEDLLTALEGDDSITGSPEFQDAKVMLAEVKAAPKINGH